MKTFVEKIESEKRSYRHFTPEQYQRINKLMEEIGSGNEESKDQLIEVIKPFVNSVAGRIATKVYGKGNVDNETVKEVVNKILGSVFGKNSTMIFDSHRGWPYLEMRIQSNLGLEFERHKIQQLKIKSAENNYMHHVSGASLDKKGPLELKDNDLYPDANIQNRQVREALERLLDSIPERKKEIFTKAFLNNMPYDDVGSEYGVTKQYIGLVVKDVLDKLKNPKGKTIILREELEKACFGDEPTPAASCRR